MHAWDLADRYSVDCALHAENANGLRYLAEEDGWGLKRNTQGSGEEMTFGSPLGDRRVKADHHNKLHDSGSWTDHFTRNGYIFKVLRKHQGHRKYPGANFYHRCFDRGSVDSRHDWEGNDRIQGQLHVGSAVHLAKTSTLFYYTSVRLFLVSCGTGRCVRQSNHLT